MIELKQKESHTMTMVECFMGNSNEPCMRFLSEQDPDQIGVTLKERGWFAESNQKFIRNWSPYIHPYRIQLHTLPILAGKLGDHLNLRTGFFGEKP